MPTRHVVLVLTVLAAAPALAPNAGAITGGRPTTTVAFPSTVALVERGAPADAGLFCGGSVVAPDAILTAAHCVTGNKAAKIEVISGRTRLTDEAAGQRNGVRSIVVHPRWNASSTLYDLAVLRLRRPVGAPALPLAAGGDSEQARATVSGWGLPRPGASISAVLRQAPLIVRSHQACRGTYSSDYRSAAMLCASGMAREGSCEGDSGGPLTATGSDGVARQIGVVSFGTSVCDTKQEPGVYARVRTSAAWIAAAAGSQPPPASQFNAR